MILSIQSTLVISKSKGPAETLRDIRTSTYQMCRIEENTKRTTKFHKWTCNLTSLIRNIGGLKILRKRGKIAPGEQFLPLSTIFYYLMLDFYVKTGIRFSLRDKQLFEITEVEITRVDCIFFRFTILILFIFLRKHIQIPFGTCRYKEISRASKTEKKILFL